MLVLYKVYYSRMTKVGLISDTHSYLDNGVFKHFETCDEIWHAGEFGTIDLADELADFKILRGVYGNIDGQDIRIKYPLHQRFLCEEVDVWITHIGGYPGNYDVKVRKEIIQNPPQLFISGHSHILKVMHDKKLNCLHLNPGAAGKQGWHKVRTLLRFCISEKRIHDMEVIELGSR